MAASRHRAWSGNLAERNLPRRFQWHDDQIAIVDRVAELVELRRKIQLRFVLS